MTKLAPKNVDQAQETDVLSNQTNFFSDELMVQSPPSLPVEHDPLAAEKALVRKKRKKLFILLGTATGAVLCVGIALLVVLTPPTEPTVIVTASPIVITQDTEVSALGKRLDELESDLRAADPIELDAPFPPVNFNLSLD